MLETWTNVKASWRLLSERKVCLFNAHPFIRIQIMAVFFFLVGK